jgi:hypothetical protein
MQERCGVDKFNYGGKIDVRSALVPKRVSAEDDRDRSEPLATRCDNVASDFLDERDVRDELTLYMSVHPIHIATGEIKDVF